MKEPKKDDKDLQEQKQGITRYSVKKIGYLKAKKIH
jgi:hypothetical protein